MKFRSIKEGPERVFVLILDQGEEAFKATRKRAFLQTAGHCLVLRMAFRLS